MFLAGCGVPTGISVVGYVAGGFSSGASGKTVNDHLVSQIMNMDCGLMRFLSGDWICRQRGVDPEDKTIYMADGRTVDGPPRPWGTNGEPELHYDDGKQNDARGWAEGVELADASIGDDPSGEIVTTDYVSDDSASPPARIGDMAAAREREESFQAVAERIRFARSLQMQYQQKAATTGYIMPQPVAYQTAEIAYQAQPSSMIILDNLAFSDSLGLDSAYRGEAPVVAAADKNLMPTPAKPAVAAEPILHQAEAIDGPAEITELAPPAKMPRLRDRGWRLAAAETYLVVGSFKERSNAVIAAALRRDAAVTVVESAVKGRTFYRLVTGPFETAKLESARQSLSAAGYTDSWSISQCGSSAADGQGCLSQTQVAALRDPANARSTIQVAGLTQ
jgi:hypothetical protein